MTKENMKISASQGDANKDPFSLCQKNIIQNLH